ncbi:MAG: hypothetical protein HY332_14420 [Chloroflexi bacterium]|nr:hypothetical protein [Chloroflexota bacterium]
MSLGGLTLENRVLVAAGCLPEQVRLPDDVGLGAIILRGVAWRRRRGAPPRLRETAAGALYTPGSARGGVAELVRRRSAPWASRPEALIVNLIGDSPDELAAAAAQLEGVRWVAAVELNLEGMRSEVDPPRGPAPEMVFEAVRGVRRGCGLPVLVKVAAGDSAVDEHLRASATAGATAATIGGGLYAGSGYLVGPATFPLVLAEVTRLAPLSPLPLLACGGVATAAHARAYLQTGAAAVQVGSAHLADPLAAVRVVEELG